MLIATKVKILTFTLNSCENGATLHKMYGSAQYCSKAA